MTGDPPEAENARGNEALAEILEWPQRVSTSLGLYLFRWIILLNYFSVGYSYRSP